MIAAPRRGGIVRRIPWSAVGVQGSALALRLVLVYVVFPGQGLVGDQSLFAEWATTLARVGPGGFYAAASSANYPPGYMYVLWLVGVEGKAVSGAFGVSADQATGSEGGFIAPSAHLAQLPVVVVYGDGRILTPAPVPAIDPGPLLPVESVRNVGVAGLAAIRAGSRRLVSTPVAARIPGSGRTPPTRSS